MAAAPAAAVAAAPLAAAPVASVIVPVHQAAALDGGQAQFSARVQARTESPAKKRAKSSGSMLGAERWGVRKAHIGGTSINNVYILYLNAEHKQLLLSAHSWACGEFHRLGQIATTAELCNKMVECFNSWHIQTIRSGRPGGYGGYMKPQLVMQFLNELGQSAVAQQHQSRVEQPVAPELPRLTDAQIDGLNRTHARELCRQWGLKVRGTVCELKLRLKDHFKKLAN